MRTHSEKAAISSFFTYSQFAFVLVSGVILFPLIIRSVGTYHYGLWLATGEAISYVLLGDLGVFAVLPWLVAGRIGAKDFVSLRQYLSNAIAIGCFIGSILLVLCVAIQLLDPSQFGIPPVMWNEVRHPMWLLLLLHGLGYPIRAFHALLVGAQDVIFSGCLALVQSSLTVILTIVMIVSGSGIFGLALAIGLPSLIIALLACLRVIWKHPYAIHKMPFPNLTGSRVLLREGFGAWLGGLGFRMMAASNGIILAAAGRPDWATIYASTGKIGQILTPMCSTIPDSGLVGISHVYASNNREQIRRSAVCLILLYVILPSFAAIGLLVANPAFVPWWIGPDLYAGHNVNIVMAISMVVAGLAGGLAKLASVVGWRQTVGWTTVVAGLVYGLLGYTLVQFRGLAGLAEATLTVWICILLPVGCYLATQIYHIKIRDFFSIGLARWFFSTIPILIIAALLGVALQPYPFLAFGASLICIGVYGLLLRPTLARPPWPAKVRSWLNRLRLIPSEQDAS